MRRLLLGAVLLPGCLATQGDVQRLDQGLDGLRAELKAEKDASQAERERLKAESAQKQKELSDAIDSLNRAARKSGADLAVDLEKAQQQITALQGQVEALTHRLDLLEQKDAEREKAAQAARDEARAKEQKRQQEAAERPTDKAALYALAMKTVDAGDYPKARDLFSDFLQRFPNDPLAANAQYWLGETWYAEKRWNDAIVEFQKVIKAHKGSEKVPDALLKIGLSFQAQKDCERALLFFDAVLQSHAKTPAAKIAREKSAECKKRK